jgi:hypothetical protein
MSRTRRFLQGLAKEMDPRTGFIKKADRRDINNLWTGYEAGGLGKSLGVAGVIGYGSYTITNAPYKRLEEEAETQEATALPGTMGDGMSYTPSAPSADGNLVFALNKLRHGG